FVAQIVLDEAPHILEAIRIGGEFDALQACAVFHDAVRATRPEFSEDRTLHLVAGRHPLLDERLAPSRAEAFGEEPSDRRVIPITVNLNNKTSALVISGPNAGGKTVALKTAGLLVAMGMSGLPVPAADGTVLPVVDALHVLVGDDQSVLEHLSTFSAYLMRLKRVLGAATDRSLVLLDELGSGTDPEEGAALAAAVIEHLLSTGALLIVTTHLSALKSFAVNDSHIVNASMEFDSATGRSTYRMITGLPGRSRAIEVAELMGLPSSIIAAARQRLGDRYGETDTLLAQLQGRMTDVLAQQDAVAAVKQEIEAERRVLAEKTAQIEKERAKLGTSYRDELERLRDDVQRQVTVEIKNLRELDRTARGRVNANTIAATLTKPVERAMEFIPTEQRDVRAGERAEHRKFKVSGEVVSINGTKAVLNVNGRRMTVETRDLVPLAGPPAKAPRPKHTTGLKRASSGDDTAEVSAELNLVGQRIEEALEQSDKFLDRALLDGRQVVRIIHGFGTGALRKAVREYLRKHPGVTSWRPGEENEGGDGATIALLV
ncbi:MAG: Smr/MutS family protein, partial [Acidobacteriota bacterium]